MRKRLLMIFIILSALVLTVVSGRSPVAWAAGNPPKDTSGILLGLDAPAFGAKQYAYVNVTNGHIIELYRTLGNHWTWTDLTQVSGAPPESIDGSFTLAAFYSARFSAKHYGYFDAAGDLIDMQASISHRSWTWTVARSGRGEGSHLIGFDSSQFGTMRYVWADIVGEPLQVFSTDGQNWSFDDMGRDSSNSLCISDPITVGFDSTGSQSTQFVNELNNPLQLPGQSPRDILESYTQSGQGSGTHWSCNDLSQNLGAPPAGGDMVGLSMPAPDNKQYAYLDEQGQLEELYLQGTSWNVARPNLSTFLGAPAANVTREGVVAGFYSSLFKGKRYAYIDQNGDIQEMSTLNGFWSRTVPSLTQVAAAPPIPSSSPFANPLIGFDSPEFHAIQWAYVDQNGDIQEIHLGDGSGLQDGSSTWQRIDLTTTTPQA